MAGEPKIYNTSYNTLESIASSCEPTFSDGKSVWDTLCKRLEAGDPIISEEIGGERKLKPFMEKIAERLSARLALFTDSATGQVRRRVDPSVLELQLRFGGTLESYRSIAYDHVPYGIDKHLVAAQ